MDGYETAGQAPERAVDQPDISAKKNDPVMLMRISRRCAFVNLDSILAVNIGRASKQSKRSRAVQLFFLFGGFDIKPSYLGEGPIMLYISDTMTAPIHRPCRHG